MQLLLILLLLAAQGGGTSEDLMPVLESMGIEGLKNTLEEAKGIAEALQAANINISENKNADETNNNYASKKGEFAFAAVTPFIDDELLCAFNGYLNEG